MRPLHPSSMFVPAFALAALAFVPALAAQDWQKSYPVSGKPSLTVSTGDASTEVRALAGGSMYRQRHGPTQSRPSRSLPPFALGARQPVGPAHDESTPPYRRFGQR